MRILIIGGGIGGMTLAALLAQRGVKPVIVERAPDFSHMGYVLGLYPLGSRVLHGLQLFSRYLELSEGMDSYEVRNGAGHLVHRYDIGEMVARFGPFRIIARADLLTLLHEGANAWAGGDGLDLRLKTTVEGLEQSASEVTVRFGDGTSDRFDLVVAADGMHSATREMLFGKVPYVETGWGCWLWWAPLAAAPHALVTEYWGAGRFVGVYPVRDRIGIVAGGPHVASTNHNAGVGRRNGLHKHFSALAGSIGPILDAIPGDDEEMFYWNLHDVRSPEWVKGRVVLLGDAACGFLPTAGVGASMAMESAAALNDELSRTDAAHMERALKLYVKRHRTRVEKAQENSRSLGKLMLVEATPLVWGRDMLMKFVTLEMLIREIGKELDEPI